MNRIPQEHLVCGALHEKEVLGYLEIRLNCGSSYRPFWHISPLRFTRHIECLSNINKEVFFNAHVWPSPLNYPLLILYMKVVCFTEKCKGPALLCFVVSCKMQFKEAGLVSWSIYRKDCIILPGFPRGWQKLAFPELASSRASVLLLWGVRPSVLSSWGRASV